VGDGLADHSGEHSWDRGTHVRPQSSGKSNLADEGLRMKAMFTEGLEVGSSCDRVIGPSKFKGLGL
jgi:hypothetical protein